MGFTCNMATVLSKFSQEMFKYCISSYCIAGRKTENSFWPANFVFVQLRHFFVWKFLSFEVFKLWRMKLETIFLTKERCINFIISMHFFHQFLTFVRTLQTFAWNSSAGTPKRARGWPGWPGEGERFLLMPYSTFVMPTFFWNSLKHGTLGRKKDNWNDI